MRHWHRPIPLTGIIEADLPDGPGVYVLLERESDPSSVVKIAAAQSLLRAFQLEFEAHRDTDGSRGFTFFETPDAASEAAGFLSEFETSRGFTPAMNAGEA